ncbi:MAG: DinB family protein [Chloroflexota bacterium]
MVAGIEESRARTLRLLDGTRRETRLLLSGLDPNRVVHTDERAWRVRDIVGHLGAWNWEAARSVKAYSEGAEYCCIPTEAEYDNYNGPAAEARRAWSMEQVWTEYETAHDELRRRIESLPDEKWAGEMLYPWNERGTVARLIEIMMIHEKRDHCSLLGGASDRG